MNPLKDIFYLFFPNTCLLCNNSLLEQEKTLCLNCSFDLPLMEVTDKSNNIVEQVFYGRVDIQFATSLLSYKRKSQVQKLIHALKYDGEEEIGVFLGQSLGGELTESKRLPKIDYVIPVPIHKRKLKKRGYNQVTKFAREIANSINAQYNDSELICVLDIDTQTHKKRLDRWQNVKEKFSLNRPSSFSNKSVLLVDDVITTGATIEACVLQLQKSKGVKISIATMAFTS